MSLELMFKSSQEAVQLSTVVTDNYCTDMHLKNSLINLT